MISMIGMYRDQPTPLHRLPAWSKVLGLVAASALALVITDPVTTVGLTCASILLLISTVPPKRATIRALVGITILSAFVSIFHIARGAYAEAIDMSADLIGLVSLSLAVTSSTSMQDMVEFGSGLFRPFKRLIPPETLGLMVAMVLRVIPAAAQNYVEARNAARARGMDRSLRAIVTPATTRTVGFAMNLGQALHARGIADEAEESESSR